MCLLVLQLEEFAGDLRFPQVFRKPGQSLTGKSTESRAANLFRKRKRLWSPDQLATTSRSFPSEPFIPLYTSKFVIDNKQLRRKMWTKVVRSG